MGVQEVLVRKAIINAVSASAGAAIKIARKASMMFELV
jgi:hypothetical protein